MASHNYNRTKYACYFSYLSMASLFTVPPMLFMTFREMYGVSYTLLGTLVVVNFCTQLSIDLVFSFFSRFFNIKKTVCIMPVLTGLGLLLYAMAPVIFPGNMYLGLVLGTVIFSVSAGLSEVLLSPIIAALPSDTPDRDMSLLHSLYAWGVVVMVGISTLFFNLFGTHNWQYLIIFLACLPIITCIMFCASYVPDINTEHEKTESTIKKRAAGIALCFACIFLGAAAENVMTNWVSSYLESALAISKTLGDIFGMALFALLLGFGRTLYARIGRNIANVLLFSMAGSVVCYLAAGISMNPLVSLISCVLTGLAVAMLWPGTLIFLEEKFPHAGVAAYALMAAGGDFGSSVAPQLMGVVVDNVAVSNFAAELSRTLSISPEQIGMKTGMILTAVFPLIGIVVVLIMKKYFAQEQEK